MKIDRTLMLVVCLPLVACAAGDDTMGPTQNSESSDDMKKAPMTANAGAGAGDEAVPTFAEVYPLIAEGCAGGKSGCHVAGASGGLEMHDAATAYAHLVDVASKKCPDEKRVVSGDADASQLVQALEGRSVCVKPMPLGRDPMNATDVAMIRAWIEGGATEE